MTSKFTTDTIATPAMQNGSSSTNSCVGNSPTISSERLKTVFDGTGRKPRVTQARAFDWLDEGWALADVHAIQSPVGSGKSAVARALQLEAAAMAIAPSNLLIDQLTGTYKYANFLKGKVHYRCNSGLSCSEWIDSLEQKPCIGCPYEDAKVRAEREPTFFNPLSLYYFNIVKRRRFPVIVVDEAHQLPGMALMLAGKRFRHSLYGFDNRCASEVFLTRWMGEQIRKLDKLARLYTKAADFRKLQEIASEVETLAVTKECLESDPENYAIYFEEGTYRGRPDRFLNVKPIRAPALLMQRLLDCDKLVLLSGTLLKTDIEDLAAGRPHRFLDLPSPIPVDRRRILYRPAPFKMNYQTDIDQLARAIKVEIAKFPPVNTLVHTTYDRARRMARYFPQTTDTPANKEVRLRAWMERGGALLAAGCAEGLDLKDDLCRLNIIPHLITPNLAEPAVKKRMALQDGKKWLDLETLKVVIQQAGRSTRHEKDHSHTVVMDSRFPDLVKRHEKELPQSFLEAISWSGQ